MDMDGKNTLQIKAIGVIISTFEPRPSCTGDHRRGWWGCTAPVRVGDPQQRFGRATHGTKHSPPVLSHTWITYKAACRRPTRNRTGTALSCATTENAISAGSDTSYSRPISALPANQSRP